MHKKLIYNGKSSADMGLVIQAPPAYSLPERDVKKTHVPGRNGDIIIDNGNYQNTEREYSLAKGYVNGPLKTTVKNGQELYEWLTSAKGRYVRLEDDYDPDVYRIATYIDSGTLTDILDQALAFNAKFNCKPQRYLKIGENPIEYAAGEESTNININNLTHYEAKPTIKIENVPAGNFSNTMLSVKDKEGTEVALITLKGSNTDTITLIIDSETEECMEEYSENGEIKYRDASDKVSLNGKNFPVLKDGNNNITIDQYNREDYQNIPSYDSIIQPKQTVCESYFSPKDTTIKSYEEKYIIRSFNSLIKERESSFAADSYYTRLTELCDQGVNKPTSMKEYVKFYFPKNKTYIEMQQLFQNNDEYRLLREANIINIGAHGQFPNKYLVDVMASQSKPVTYIKDSTTTIVTCYSNQNILDSNNPQAEDYLWFRVGDTITKNLDYATSYTIINPDQYFSNGITITFPYTSLGNMSGFLEKYGLNDALEIQSPQSAGGDRNSYQVTVKTGHTLYTKREGINRISYTPGGYSILDMYLDQADVRLEIYPDVLTQINDDLPSFIKASEGIINFDGDKTALDSITYQFDFSDYVGVNAVNLYWKDKNGLFGKAGWVKCNNNDVIINYIWDDWRKSLSQNGKILSLNNDFSLRFVRFDSVSKDYLQYDFGVNISPIFEVELTNEPSLVIKAKKTGYYKVNIGISASWVEKNANQTVDTIALDKSFSVEYLKEFPRYSNESDWPSWLDNIPVYIKNSSEVSSYVDKLNADGIKFKVNLDAYYRIYEIINEVEHEGSFTQKNVGYYLPDYEGSGESQVTFEDSLTVGRYYSDKWPDPSMVPNFPYDRANSINSQAPEVDDPDTPDVDEYIPDWLQYEVKMKVKFNSSPNIEYNAHRTLIDGNNKFEWITEANTTDPTEINFYTHERWFGYLNEKIYDSDGNEKGYITEEPTIYFYPGKNDGGFYKYDNSNVWVHYNATPTISSTSTPIIKIGFQDSVTFYYIDAMPDYEEGDWLEYLEIERNPSGNQESPVSIKFKIKNDNAEGYYKANSQVHWKYYKAGETVLETLVNETNTISRLTPNQTSGVLDEIKITITPKWWML